MDVKQNRDKDVTHVMPSEEFWKKNRKKWDIIFIDGDHSCHVAHLDILEALDVLRDGGVIIVHDCLPDKARNQGPVRERPGPWYGEVWKAWLRVCASGAPTITIDTDCGLGVLDWSLEGQEVAIPEGVDFNWFRSHGGPIIRITDVEEALSLL